MENPNEITILSQISYNSLLKLIKLNITDSLLDLLTENIFPQYITNPSSYNSNQTFQSYYSKVPSTTLNESYFLAHYVMYVYECFSKELQLSSSLIEISLSEILSLKDNYSYNSLFTIAKITLLFGLINHKNIIITQLNGKLIQTENFIIAGMQFINDVLKESNKNKDDQCVLSYLNFISDILLSNPDNSIILSKRTCVFIFLIQTMLYNDYSNEINSKIKEIVFKLYEWRLPKQVIMALLANFPNLMINYNQKPISVLLTELKYAEMELELIANIIDKETHLISKDPFHLRKYFYCTNSIKSGMSFLYNLGELKESSIIFSFNWSSVPNESKYNIISFTKSSFSNVLSFVIENGEFIIYSFNNRISTQIIIEQKKTYLFTIGISPSITKSKTGSIYLQYNSSSKLNFDSTANYSQKNISCSIGYFPTNKGSKYHFNGTIGTIIITNKLLSEDQLTNLFKLNGYYDILPYLSTHIDKYLFIYENIKRYKTNRFVEGYTFFQNNANRELKYNYIIDPILFNDSNDDTNKQYYNLRLFNEHNKGNLSKYQVELLSPFSINFDVITFNSATSEFLRNEGIKYLTLHLIHYSNLLQHKLKNNDFNQELRTKM